ncbi:MAG: rod shape-determining protein MreC [Chitinophagaceae bacterium]
MTKNISDYLYLKKINQNLIEENTYLRNQLTYNYITYQKNNDTNIVFLQQYKWIKAEAIDFIKKQENLFLIIRSGKEEGIEENMALVSSLGIAGNIIKVYNNYSVATTLFNEKTKVIGTVSSNNTFCALEWIAMEPTLLICKNFPHNTNTKVKDTIITSNYSVKYPPNLPIGIIEEIIENKQTRELTLKVKPFVDYNVLSQVYVIKNKDHDILKTIKSDVSEE